MEAILFGIGWFLAAVFATLWVKGRTMRMGEKNRVWNDGYTRGLQDVEKKHILIPRK